MCMFQRFTLFYEMCVMLTLGAPNDSYRRMFKNIRQLHKLLRDKSNVKIFLKKNTPYLILHCKHSFNEE